MIDTKQKFMRMAKAGLCGNQLRTFDTLSDLEKSGYDGYLTIRAHSRDSKWFVAISHTGLVLERELFHIVNQGGPGAAAFYFQEIPDPALIRHANIEAGTIPVEPYFGRMCVYLETATTEPVRGIRERNQPETGMVAGIKMRHAFRQDSLDELNRLWDLYPGHIIEASEFPVRVGTDHKHLVIWEIRKY